METTEEKKLRKISPLSFSLKGNRAKCKIPIYLHFAFPCGIHNFICKAPSQRKINHHCYLHSATFSISHRNQINRNDSTNLKPILSVIRPLPIRRPHRMLSWLGIETDDGLLQSNSGEIGSPSRESVMMFVGRTRTSSAYSENPRARFRVSRERSMECEVWETEKEETE